MKAYKRFWILILFFCIYGCDDPMLNPIVEPVRDAVTEKPAPEPTPEPTPETDDDDVIVLTGTTYVLQPTITPPLTLPAVEIPLPVVIRPPVIEEPVIVEEPRVSFKNDIQPILENRCAFVGCHGASSPVRLDLRNYEGLKRGSSQSDVFIAGNGNSSLIVRRIDGGGMPPIKPPLNAEQIQLFIDWIDDGAENN